MGSGERHHVVVAGAGPAGLATAARLRALGREVVVLERSEAVGASWRERYAGLRLNTMRQFSGLPGLRIPRSCGRYPTREDYVAYLDAYVAHHRLDVRFGTALEWVDRADDDWLLRTSAGDLVARHAIIATGYDAVPVLPPWACDKGTVPLLHAADVRDPAAHAGQEVLVVGGGNTGIDLAGLLVRGGARVTLSVRTPPSIFPRDLWGSPLQPSGILLDHLPARVGDALGRATQRLAFGDLSRHGIPRAPEGYQTHFRRTYRGAAVDDGFVAALKAGRARVVGDVAALDGAAAVLVDGTRLRVDAVVCSTGYRRGLEPLVGHLGVLDDDGVPLHHAAPEHPAAPRLYFAGFYGTNAGQLRWMPIHARRIARAVRRHDGRTAAGPLAARDEGPVPAPR